MLCPVKKFPLLAAAVVLAAPSLSVATGASAVPTAAPAPAASAPTKVPASASGTDDAAPLATPASDTLATQTPREPGAGESGAGADAKVGVAGSATVVGLRGRGFGHGRGMSQWGARGAASQGLTADQILAFYYPNTVKADIGNPDVRVRLTAFDGRVLVVAAEPGLTLTDGTCTADLTANNVKWWRVSPTTGGYKVEGYYTSSTGFESWYQYPSTCPGFSTATSLTFVGDGSVESSVLRTLNGSTQREYRGALRYTPVTTRYTGGQSIFHSAVNVLPMNTYLRSVVPAEMPASWALEAVKAQAVAARSYAAARLGSPDGWDVCDTTACQVYPGLTSSNPEHPNSDAAVTATSGHVRKYGSSVALTEFSSTNGGFTTGSNLAYQVAKADPYDGVYADAPDTWSYLTMPVTAIENAWPAIGTFRSAELTRDNKGAWFGGRVTWITLYGSGGSVGVAPETFRSRLNLRSTWFIPVGSSVGSDFSGNAFSDLVARDATGRLWSYRGDGRGSWLGRIEAAPSFPAAPELLAPGDFSGDGIPDLMTRSTSTGALTLHRGTATGTIASASQVGSGWHSFTAVVAPGDLDGDGAVDILGRDAAGVMWLYPGNGAGSWKARVSRGAGWGSLQELEAVGDFDGDGGTDLMAKNSAGTLYLLRFSPTGAYLGNKAIGVGFGAFSGFTGMGDVDGDGAVDLVTRDSTGKLWAYRGTGSGTFTTRLAIGSGWNGLTFGS